MTQDQMHKILEKLAYYYGELCKHNNIATTNELNYKKAEEMFNTVMRIDGEEGLLCYLKEDENETKN